MAEPRTARALVTAEELLAMPDGGGLCELIDGVIVPRTPGGCWHGALGMEVQMSLWLYAKEHHAGRVMPSNAGLWLRRDPDTVRCADASFTVVSRVPPVSDGYYAVVPDLTVEVVDWWEHATHFLAKVGEWLEAGVRVVWVVWPQREQVLVYRDFDKVEKLGPDDTLTCEELLPGFALPIAALFADD